MKILGKDLEKALAGLPLLVAHKEDEIPVLKVETQTYTIRFKALEQIELVVRDAQLNNLCWFSGRTGAGAQTHPELHQTGGERSLCAGVHAGISGGSARVPPHI